MRGARHLCLLGLLGLLAQALACPGDVSYIEVQIVPSGPDPLQGVKTIRLEATGPAPMTPVKAEASIGEHQVWLTAIPPGVGRVITVEGLDGDGVAIARGESAPFEVTATSPTTVSVTFVRCATIVYRDGDHDGFGDPAGGKSACSKQAGFVDNNTDCDDADSRAHPGQQSFFDTESTGKKSFDFNCDGKTEQELGALVACAKVPPSCAGDGWVGSVPACGQSGDYAPCEKGSCNQGATTTRKQACR